MKLPGPVILLLFIVSAGAVVAHAQTILPKADAGEKPGERPYEMVWANRREPSPPTVRFDDLRGWTMRVSGGAAASLQATRAQNIWNRPVARLRYRGDAKPASQPTIELTPAAPVELPAQSDSVDMWVYGNRWDWVNPPGTPPVRILLHIKGPGGSAYDVPVDTVRWEEWWLMHCKLPTGLKFPALLDTVEVTGGSQGEWRDIYFDSIRFYRETTAPLHFAPRPTRNLTLFPGQSPGGNSGPGRLTFPTREETILPMQMAGPFRNAVKPDGQVYIFDYIGKDGHIRYRFDPRKGLDGITVELDGATVGRLMEGGGLKFADGRPALFRIARQVGQEVVAEYNPATTLRLHVRQKSLIVDIINPTGQATEVSFGQLSGVTEPRTIYVPPITYGGSNPTILLSRAGVKRAYTSIWPDWYRSNGSELVGAEEASEHTARINGSILYHPRTDGKRNPLFERIFVTVSPRFEEVLPVIPNPTGLHASDAVDRLWQETWGPENYATQMKRSEMLRAYGIEKLIQCNHEITWRDGGESFTLRTHAAPKKGGDEALQRYVTHQRGLGWNSGLYTNYTDFIPVNEYWTPDGVQRLSDGSWRSGWPRCWAEKPMKAVEFDALLAPRIKRRYNPNSAYTDVSTAVAPWGYTDFDARVPGAGTFAQTFYCYGELLRNDSRVYGGPIFSEGTYQWLYAGLADGNYGHTYNGRNLATQPLLPVFDLYQIHSKECDIGVSWTSFFCDTIPNWKAPESIDRAIDRFLLATLAYGHIGWLVEEEHGISRTCRSYYMLQQVQARYGLKQPTRIAYWDGARLRTVSEAIDLNLAAVRRQLYLEYPGGLRLWLNDHQTEEWRVHAGGREILLPPAGWAAIVDKGIPGSKVVGHGGRRHRDSLPSDSLLSYSALNETGRVDYLRSAAYTYQDGRGRWFSTADAGSNGALAITRTGTNRLRIIRIAGDGEFMIHRPYGTIGPVSGCKAFGADGKPLQPPRIHDSGMETWIEPVRDAIRYELAFSGSRSWAAAPSAGQAAPGSSVPLTVSGNQPVKWEAQGAAQVNSAALRIPDNAVVGSVVRARVLSNGQAREVTVRVCAPVEIRWRTQSNPDHVYLALATTWNLRGLTPGPVSFVMSAPEGWSVSPDSDIRINPAAPPAEVGFALYSAAPAGAVGQLEVQVKGLPQPPRMLFSLRRVAENPTTTDLQKSPFAWGLARRGQAESRATDGSGAICSPDTGLTVGGVTRGGIFMHPPYNGGVGYTWADFGPLQVPYAPAEFRASIGIKDGGDTSDGVRFMLDIVDAKGVHGRLIDEIGVQHSWREVKADLSAYAGQRVHIRLIADAGPNDNSTADWGCWGEPRILLSTPHVITEITQAGGP